jgi:5-methylcytosine-specific restriction enzyme A
MRVCSGPGCLRAVPDDVRFCDECKPQRSPLDDDIRSHTTGYDDTLDALRKSLRWQRLRARVIREQPLCARCQQRISEIVDRIVPALVAINQARDSKRYPLDKWAGYFLRSNLQGLCRPCHGDKTLEDKAHVGEWPDVVAIEAATPKRAWTL